MAKYIIELERGETAYKTVNSNGKPMIQLLAPTPYTEPDTEKVREEAFKNGYDAACKDIDIKSKINAAYRKGLEDAWECARKITRYWIRDGRTSEAKEIFGTDDIIAIFKSFSVSEALEKIRQYEQEKEEIKVGNEVVSEDDIKAVVIDMDDYLLHVLDENGVVQGWPREDVAKTGRHFPEIAAVLEKMREDAT